MSRFHNILVAIDFSPTSHEALAVAVGVSRAEHSRLHLIHVVPEVQVPYTIEPVAFDFSGLLQDSIDSAREQLGASIAPFGVDPNLVTIAVPSGPPAAEIVRYAEANAIDLIVMGRHGHGFVDRLLVGSVGERVARHAPCAVLMIPHVARHPTSFEVKAAAGVEG